MTRRTSPKARTARRAISLPKLRLEGRHLWILGATALVGLAALNATLLQPGTHPAPLFGADKAVRPAALSVRAGPLPDPHVKELQSRLRAMGFYTGELDGLMGQQTLSATYEALDDATQPAEGRVVVPTSVRSVETYTTPINVSDASTLSPEDRAAGSAADPLGALLSRTPPRRVTSTSRAEPVSETDLIRQVQEQLTARGYAPGPVDGVIGTATRDAVRAFQSDEGVTPTGRMDAQTLDRLGLSALQQS